MHAHKQGKERGSVLLSAMTRVYGTEQFFEGFIATLRNMDDLALDTPRAVEIFALFIARCVCVAVCVAACACACGVQRLFGTSE